MEEIPAGPFFTSQIVNAFFDVLAPDPGALAAGEQITVPYAHNKRKRCNEIIALKLPEIDVQKEDAHLIIDQLNRRKRAAVVGNAGTA